MTNNHFTSLLQEINVLPTNILPHKVGKAKLS